MIYLHNDKLANIISERVSTLVSRKLKQGKRILDIKSIGFYDGIRCFFFIDENQEHIVHGAKEFREETNGYDIEILMTHWNFIDIEDDDSSLYVYDAKVFEIGILSTDSFTASTDVLDELWEDKDTKILKRLYAYKDEIFDSEADLKQYLMNNRECE